MSFGQPPSNIPQTAWERMPQNVKDIYLEQQKQQAQAAQDQAKQQSRMQNWKGVTVTGQVLKGTEWGSERAQRIVNYAPISAIRESDISRKTEPLGAAQHSTAGFVGSFESVVRPEVPSVGGAVSENVMNRVFPQPKIEGYNVKTDWYQQQMKELGPGYAVGSLFGTAVLTYAVGKGESWLLSKGEEYAMSSHVKKTAESSLWKNAQVNYESPEAGRIFQQAELKSLNVELAEEYGFKTGEFGGASSWAKSTLYQPATKGAGYSPWTFDFIQSQETLPSVKPFTPLFEDYFSEAITPKSSRGFLPALIAIPRITPNYQLTQKNVQKDFVFGGTKQGPVSSPQEFQKNLVNPSRIKSQQYYFSEYKFKQDLFQKQDITPISLQKTFQQQKLGQQQYSPFIQQFIPRTAKPKAGTEFPPFLKFKMQRTKKGERQGWFGRMWPSALDPEKMFKQQRRSKRRGSFSFGF
jgi:hypothetical protein